jgi:hypothetical protein
MVDRSEMSSIGNLAAEPSALPASARTRILIYLGVLLVLLGFGSPGGGLIPAANQFPAEEQAPLEGARDGDIQPDRRGTELRILPLWICARHLESSAITDKLSASPSSSP